MRTKVEVQYRKRSNKRLPVAQYRLHGYRDKDGKAVITKAVVKADPLLKEKRNARLAKVILKHESDEAIARSKGLPLREADKLARSKEPHWFRNKYRTHIQLLRALR